MKPPALAPGVPVEVVQGLAVGRRGVVIEKWAQHFGRGHGPAMWRVGFREELIRDRILRGDFLKVLSADVEL